MTPSAARSNPIRRLARSQSPLTIAVEILFALLLVAAFWYSRNSALFTARTQPTPQVEVLAQQSAAPTPESTFLAQLTSFDPMDRECRQLIANGSFEQTGNWQLPLTARPAAYTNEQASEGSRSLRLGIGPTDQLAYSESQASQTVDLPTDAQMLVLVADVQRTAAGEGSDRQFLHVRVGPNIHTLFNDRVDLPAWQPVIYDLTVLAGSRVELIFGVFNSGGPGRVAMAVDNVRLYACGQPPVAIAPVPDTPTVTATADTQINPPASLSPTTGPTQATTRASPTPTQTQPPSCTELVANGDFEFNDGWTVPNTPYPARFATEPSWSGSRSMGLGIAPGQSNLPSDSTAYQPITLPAGNMQITLRAAVWRAGSGGGDFHYVWVTSEGKTNRVLQGLDDSRRWQEISYDLTPLAGKRIFLLLGTYNDGTDGVASMFADGVSIQACSSTAILVPITPTPSPPPTATPVRAAISSVQHPSEMRSPDFGANAFLWQGQEIADRDLQLMKEAGFRWVRQRFSWEEMQAAPGQYMMNFADSVVAQVNDNELFLLAQLDMNPDSPGFWAGQPPHSNASFVEFIATLVRRYDCTAQDRCVHAWQVGSEPNLSSQWGGNRPDPAAYAALLGRVYSAIKTANPYALVISAGMAPTATNNETAMPDTRFYQEMYAAMGGSSEGYFDVLGVNAPGFAAPPEMDPAEVAATPNYGGQRIFAFRHVEDIREIMEANGDRDKRIVVLEFGWSSDPVNPENIWFGADAGIDEFVKADYLRRAYVYAAQNWQPWIGLMSVQTMADLDWLADGNPFDEAQYWWAILEPSRVDELRLRPAFVELCMYLSGLQGQECPYRPD